MEIVIVACIIFTAQSIFGFMQINYYRKHMNRITEKYSSSENYYLYSSMHKKRFGLSSIAIIVVDGNDVVKECQVLHGKSVFAKFKLFEQFHEKKLLQIQEELKQNKNLRKLYIWEEAIIKTVSNRQIN